MNRLLYRGYLLLLSYCHVQIVLHSAINLENFMVMSASMSAIWLTLGTNENSGDSQVSSQPVDPKSKCCHPYPCTSVIPIRGCIRLFSPPAVCHQDC